MLAPSVCLVVLLATACPRPTGSEDDPATEAEIIEAVGGGQGGMEPCTVVAPCPEQAAKVEAIAPDDSRIESALFIDARPSEAFESWHPTGATNVVYDILDPPPADTIEELAAKGAPLVVVYGDGEEPDSGEELARDLASQGVENVYFIEGGAKTLRGSKKTKNDE